MDDHESRATARFDAAVRDALKTAAGTDATHETPFLIVSAGRDIVFGAPGEPAADDRASRDRDMQSWRPLHYAALGSLSVAVLFLIILVALLLGTDRPQIKPSDARPRLGSFPIKPSDAAFFMVFFGSAALKARSNALFNVIPCPILFRSIPLRRRSIHLSPNSGGRVRGVAFSLVTFSWPSKRK